MIRMKMLPLVEVPNVSEDVTYAIYATPRSTSVVGSNGDSLAMVCTTAVGRFPVCQSLSDIAIVATPH